MRCFYLCSLILNLLLFGACDTVNTDEAEETTIEQYPSTNTGSFAEATYFNPYLHQCKPSNT